MRARNYATLAWFGSGFAIAAALYFQFFRGLDPCVLCLYQRWPHYIVIVLGGFAIWRFPAMRLLMGVAMLAAVGVAGFHAGVEYGWWEGLQSCSGAVGVISAQELLAKPPARCDEIAWSLFGLSMAAWNGLLSLGLAGLWFLSFVKIS